MLTNPAISTGTVSVDGNRFGGSITIAGRSYPVVLVLSNEKASNYEFLQDILAFVFSLD